MGIILIPEFKTTVKASKYKPKQTDTLNTINTFIRQHELHDFSVGQLLT